MNELLPRRDFDDGLSRGGRIFLWVYLFIHAVGLPLGLNLLEYYLPAIAASAAYINFIYYAFGAVLIFVVIRRAFRTGFDALCDNPLAVTYTVLLGYMHSRSPSRSQKAISGSIIQNSAAWRWVLEFSARKVGPKV